MPSIIYGPVPSWRLGRSLGIDMVSTRGKTCSFDCIYCQLGKTRYPFGGRREFVPLSVLEDQLKGLGPIDADYVTFSGMAEPTLASNLGEAISLVKSVLPIPVAVLTNASLMLRHDVRSDLLRADKVVAKVDAPNEEVFQEINSPVVPISFSEVLLGIRRFREEFGGRLALQMMFVEANRGLARKMAELVRALGPDEMELNTPLRPSPVRHLTPDELAEVRKAFEGLPVVSVYDPRPALHVVPIDEQETARRRPTRPG